MIADPPYNIGKDFGNTKDNQELPDYLQWCDRWIAECLRLVKSAAPIFIYGFPEILAHTSVSSRRKSLFASIIIRQTAFASISGFEIYFC